MDHLVSKKASSVMKNRPSLSLLFSPQKPTFTFADDEPSRYYNFVDTPVQHKPASPLIDRQAIDPDLESDIRFSCSLLIYRIERGVPAPKDQSKKSEYAETRPGTAVPQIDSKYQAPNVGPEAAALKGKFDSGVGLTAQPSQQTMRLLLQSSHSDRPSEFETSRSVFSQRRCTTAGSVTTYTDNSSQRSLNSRQAEMQSMTGVTLSGQAPPQNHDTRAFLSGKEKPQSPNTDDDDSSDDVEVFLSPDAAFSSSGVPSFCSPPTTLSAASPSFGLSEDYASIQQSKRYEGPEVMTEGPGNSIGLGDSVENENYGPGVVIDSNGFMHVLSAEEESKRDVGIRQAVMARMNAGHSRPETSGPQTRIAAPPPAYMAPDRRPPTAMSRLQTSWSTRTKGTFSKWKSRNSDLPSQPPVPETGFFHRVAGLFGGCIKSPEA
ncbi:hypothetical protein FE257_005255 [Aspergillus nanangensis]|uniref:Uncharacterized protein n=1 Tax=Aspergillus nanangensis TaxID=2582783 RepID=A0AAD4GWY5_ASPNN|nr:hypothetical protein FE257_005255 [Aspergillus nanangensis]